MPFIQQTSMDPVCAQPVLGLGPPGRPVLRAGMTPLKGLAHRPSRCAQRGSIQKAAGSGRGFYLQPGPPKLPQTSKCLLGLFAFLSNSHLPQVSSSPPTSPSPQPGPSSSWPSGSYHTHRSMAQPLLSQPVIVLLCFTKDHQGSGPT